MALKPKTVPVAPVAPVEVQADVATVSEPVNSGNTKNTDERTAVAKSLRAAGQELVKQEKAAGVDVVKGSKRGAVRFIQALGNPASPVKGTKGTESYDSIEIVGYEVEVLEDIEVPVHSRVGITKKNVMAFSDETMVVAPAGSKVILSISEVGRMITRLEFDGMFTGGGVSVEVGMTVSKSQGTQYTPRVLLKKVLTETDTATIKESVKAVAVRNPSSTGNSIKDFTILPEYEEKFGYIFKPVESAGRTSTGAKKREVGENAAEIAAALRAYYNKAN